jgi:hypothetical protein
VVRPALNSPTRAGFAPIYPSTCFWAVKILWASSSKEFVFR